MHQNYCIFMSKDGPFFPTSVFFAWKSQLWLISGRGIYTGFVGVEQAGRLGTLSPLDSQNYKRVFTWELICLHCSCSVCFVPLCLFLSVCWRSLELAVLYSASLSKLTTLTLESIPQHINHFL